jgi:peptidyl-tRNA hydrolase
MNSSQLEVKDGDKLYLVTRTDLSPGQRAVQAAHAIPEFAVEHPDLYRAWHEGSNTLAILEVPNEAALKRLLERAERRGLHFSEFHEPDRGGELTAAALGPAARNLCRDLPLALRLSA